MFTLIEVGNLEPSRGGPPWLVLEYLEGTDLYLLAHNPNWAVPPGARWRLKSTPLTVTVPVFPFIAQFQDLSTVPPTASERDQSAALAPLFVTVTVSHHPEPQSESR